MRWVWKTHPVRKVRGRDNFAELLREAEVVSVAGWDFSWLDGRAKEERPSWGYSRLAAERVSGADSVVDLDTGSGEVLAGVLAAAGSSPRRVAATESWPPNLRLASTSLRPFAGSVVEVGDDSDLPFLRESFDLVLSRHPVTTRWGEVARVLDGGGTFLSQQVGPGSNRELTDFMMGAQPVSDVRSPTSAAKMAEAAGLVVVDVRQESLRTVFDDVGAVVYFLRKVVWTVPGFSVETYRDRLATLHHQIKRDGPFVAHSERFLIEAKKPCG